MFHFSERGVHQTATTNGRIGSTVHPTATLLGPVSGVRPSPLRIAPMPGLCNLRTKNRNRTVHSAGSFDRRGNSSRHDDASCRDAPRTCRRSPCSSSRGRASKSGANSSAPRDCTSPGTTSARRSVCSQEARCHRVPAFAFARAACNLLPPRVTTSSTFLPGRLCYVLFRAGILKFRNVGRTRPASIKIDVILRVADGIIVFASIIKGQGGKYARHFVLAVLTGDKM